MTGRYSSGGVVKLAAIILLSANVLALTAQSGQASPFSCLPKAERAAADKLLAKCGPYYGKMEKALKSGLEPLLSEADGIKEIVDRARLRRLMEREGLSRMDDSGTANAAGEIETAEAALLEACSRYSIASKAPVPPPEAIALAKLLRAKAVKADTAALEKADKAISACFPGRFSEILKGLGSSFRSGGAAAYLAYIACLCESWLIDPDPFERLESAQANSLNDANAAKAALRGIRDALTIQRAFLGHPGFFAYPPFFFSESALAELPGGQESYDLAIAMATGGTSEWEDASALMSEGLRTRFVACGRFLGVLPDSALGRLAETMGREGPPFFAVRDGQSAGSEEAWIGDIEKALGLLLEFEAAFATGDREKAMGPAVSIIQDRTACLLIGSSGRYAGLRKSFLDFLGSRYSSYAAAAYPGTQARVFVALEGKSLNAAILLEEGELWSLPLTETDIRGKMKSAAVSAQDLAVLSALAARERIVSLSPLRVLPRDDEEAFAWRYRLFGDWR